VRVAFPFRIDGRGRTAAVDETEHVRHLIEQVLFTVPGERVNRPDFGTGLGQLAFAANSSDELASATQLLVQGALHHWLGDRIQIDAVEVASEEATLRVTVRYTVRQTREQRAVQLEGTAGA
jgi:phage baseplate assembly protein W